MAATPSSASAREAPRAILERAVRDGAFPGAVAEVGTATQVSWSGAVGRLRYDTDAAPAASDTIYDLASLTKVLSTTTLLMQLVERGALSLDDPVAAHVEAWTGDDRRTVTVRDLLAHCGGLAAWQPLFHTLSGRAAFEPAICASPLAYPPRSRSVYSDLGFMLLGFILAHEIPLAARFDTLLTQVGGAPEIQFNPPAIWRSRIAPTEADPWRGRTLVGEVHDENAFVLGGVAGHAGLFGTASAVGTLARHLLQVLDGRAGAVRRDTVLEFSARRPDIPGSSRALGWDTALPTSSCGGRMSARAFGHAGFTGTSLWIDPERGVYVVLLTNRVHPTRANELIKDVRPRFHDAVMDALDARAI